MKDVHNLDDSAQEANGRKGRLTRLEEQRATMCEGIGLSLYYSFLVKVFNSPCSLSPGVISRHDSAVRHEEA